MKTIVIFCIALALAQLGTMYAIYDTFGHIRVNCIYGTD